MKAGKERKRKQAHELKVGQFLAQSLPKKRTSLPACKVRRSHGNAKGKPVKWVKVCDIINAEGHRNRSGGEFKPPYVHKLAKQNGIA